MSSDSNESCIYYDVETASVGYSEGFKIFEWVFTILALAMLFVSAVLWYRWRNNLYLARRNPFLLFLSGVGLVVQCVFVGSLPRAVDEVFVWPCLIFAGSFLFCFPLIIWPQTVRVLLYHYRVIYHRQLAKENFKQAQNEEGFAANIDRFEESVQLLRLKGARFLASKKFGAFVTLVPLFFFLVSSLGVAYVASCPACPDEPFETWTTLSFVYFGAAGVFLFLFNIGLLYTVRDDPDPLKIQRETKWSWGLGLSLSLLGGSLGFFNVGGLSDLDPQPFSMFVLLDLAAVAFVAVLVPLQLYYAAQPVATVKPGKLKEILKNNSGLHYFGQYLATELSLENLLFYNSVHEWKSKYEDLSEDDRFKEALSIYINFVASNAKHQVNISYSVKSKIDEVFELSRTSVVAPGRLSIRISRRNPVQDTVEEAPPTTNRNFLSRAFASVRAFDSSGNLNSSRKVVTVPKSIFKNALSEIYDLMETDCLPRFRKSSLYQQYLGVEEPEGEDVPISSVVGNLMEGLKEKVKTEI